MLQEATRAVTRFDDREESFVVDDPDDPLAVEVVVHIHNTEDGRWHKLTPNHLRTSCGKQFNAATSVPRKEELSNAETLCTTCFTAYEIQLAADADADRRRDTLDQAPISLRSWLDDPSRSTVHGAKRRK
jgi:hypothetical protein